MDMDDFQKGALRTARFPAGQTGTYYCALGLAGEAGEVANKVKKLIRDHNGQAPTIGQAAALADELGDTLWYVAALAHQLGFTLSGIGSRCLDKLADRDRRGAISGEGDNR